jgi:hypothetical protein
MSQPSANCPQCGAPVQFRWAGSVQTTCEFCHSILVRTDVDLSKVGVVASLPADASPLQIGSEGVFENKPFVVVGRIIYEYELGGWNEWHIVFSDSTSGWLADAQLEYDVSVARPPQKPLPASQEMYRGQTCDFEGRHYETTSLTTAHYKGVQGELPFQYWDKQDVVFADLRSNDGHFATIDYTENPPLLFLGRAAGFDELRLKNLREFEGWR